MTSDGAVGVGGARAARTRWIAVGGTAVVLLLVAVCIGAWRAGSSGVSIASGVLAGVLGLALIVVVPVRRTSDRLTLLSEHVACVRPRGTVIRALAGVEMRAIARSLDSTTSGWSRAGGSALVVCVTEHRVEVWNGRAEPAPRWSVDRASARVARRDVVIGGFPWPGIQVADGLHRVVVAPQYRTKYVFSSGREEYVQRALVDLGADPHAPGPGHRDEDEHGAHSYRWHPQMTRELLRGPSARWWESTTMALLAAGLFFFVAVLAAVFVNLSSKDQPPWAYPVLFAFLGCALLVGRTGFSPILWITDRRIESEYAAGYATSRASTLDVDAPVDVVDPRSRRVIRSAGEPARADRMRQKALLRDRTRLARDAARGRSAPGTSSEADRGGRRLV